MTVPAKLIVAAKRKYPNRASCGSKDILTLQQGYIDAAMIAIEIINTCNDPAEAYDKLQEIERALCTQSGLTLQGAIQKALEECE